MFEKLILKLTHRPKAVRDPIDEPAEISATDNERDPDKEVMPTLGLELTQFLSELNIKSVDIGARGEAVSSLKLIAAAVDYYACEPESKANLDLLHSVESQIWRSYTLFNEAIGTGKHGAVLHITRQPGLSSLLQPDPDIFSRYYNDDSFRVVDSEQVNLTSLDEAARNNGFEDACFLKIDTQGSELDILESGRELLSSSLVGVYVEVEFQPFYVNQPLFRDVDKLLAAHGFTLFDIFKSSIRRVNYNPNQYSRRQSVWAHVLYLKDLEAWKIHPDQGIKVGQLFALAFAFEHFDYCLEILNQVRTLNNSNPRLLENIRNEVNVVIDERTRTALETMTHAKVSSHARKEIREWFE